jgi:glyoxylase I family protein
MKKIINEDYSFVAKINVADLEESASWYEKCLGFERNRSFDTESWTQMRTHVDSVEIGLFKSTPSGTGKGVLTIVVNNIEEARQSLINAGVDVKPIQQPSPKVKFASFQDLDGNSLGLRQNTN